MDTRIAFFNGMGIRRHWDETDEKWYFSVVDVIAALTDSENPAVYWRVMKKRLIDEGGSETVTKCNGLKMMATDGKLRLTDCADTEVLFRLIQSIPSPKAEPFKLWLARVAFDRVREIENPELAMHRMRALYEQKGYPKEWIEKRVRGIAVRQSLTKEWDNRGAETDIEYAILTNDIMEGAFGLKIEKYKKLKGLKRENLRDHMEDMELILTMLGEATTTKLTRDRDSKGLPTLRKDAQDGGAVAGRTRNDIELQSGNQVISRGNYLGLKKKKHLKGGEL